MRTGLTPREFEVVRLRAHGLTVEDIAHRLGISRATAGTYHRMACAKYGASGLIDLLTILGWLKVPE